jgi:predicted alpha/beta hydrolase family esterase
MLNTIFVPGYGNSTKGHWQEILYKETTNAHWVEQTDWDSPNSIKWIETLNALIQSLDGPIFLIAHSLGGNTVVEWSKKYSANILGAVLVSFPDVEGENFPDVITGYQTPPLIKLPFPCLALASLDDPYSSLGRTKYFVEKWGCELITIGKKGHVNIDSGLGDWPQGKNLIINFQNSLYAKL